MQKMDLLSCPWLLSSHHWLRYSHTRKNHPTGKAVLVALRISRALHAWYQHSPLLQLLHWPSAVNSCCSTPPPILEEESLLQVNVENMNFRVRKLDLSAIKTISSVQLLSCVRLFVTLWTAAPWASLSITNSWSLLKLMSIESVMLSIHLILCHPLLLLPSIFPSIRNPWTVWKGFHRSAYNYRIHWLWASLVVQVIKNPVANAGDARDMGSVPGLGRSPGGRNGNPL